MEKRQNAELIVSALEDYKHYKHFFIKEKDSAGYSTDMERTLKLILRTNNG